MLEHLDISKWDVSNVSEVRQMFKDCKQLRILNGSCDFKDMMLIKDMRGVFNIFDVSIFAYNVLKPSYRMFSGCTNLNTIYMKHINFNKLLSANMFADCKCTVRFTDSDEVVDAYTLCA